jgi:hypothetical protein
MEDAVSRACQFLYAFLFVVLAGSPGFAQEKNKADHEALRALMKKCTDAMNANKLSDLDGSVDSTFTAITVNHKKLNFSEFKSEWAKLMTGDKAVLKKVDIKPTAAGLTEFLSPTVGVCHGVSVDTYTFTDGDVRTMTIMWTAVVRRVGQQWKLAAVHCSADLLNNPVLEASKGYIYKAGGAGAGAGLLVGLLLLAALRKKS